MLRQERASGTVGSAMPSRAPEPQSFTGQVRECTKCHRVQPMDHFPNDRTKLHGKDTWCRLCMREYGQRRTSRGAAVPG
jgi:hypothetical protein